VTNAAPRILDARNKRHLELLRGLYPHADESIRERLGQERQPLALFTLGIDIIDCHTAGIDLRTTEISEFTYFLCRKNNGLLFVIHPQQ